MSDEPHKKSPIQLLIREVSDGANTYIQAEVQQATITFAKQKNNFFQILLPQHFVYTIFLVPLHRPILLLLRVVSETNVF